MVCGGRYEQIYRRHHQLLKPRRFHRKLPVPDRQDPETYQKVQRGSSLILNLREYLRRPAFHYGFQAVFFHILHISGAESH